MYHEECRTLPKRAAAAKKLGAVKNLHFWRLKENHQNFRGWLKWFCFARLQVHMTYQCNNLHQVLMFHSIFLRETCRHFKQLESASGIQSDCMWGLPSPNPWQPVHLSCWSKPIFVILVTSNCCMTGLFLETPIFLSESLDVDLMEKNRFSKLVSNWSFPSTPLSPATTDWVDCSPAMGGSKPRFLQFWISNFCCHQSDRLLMTLVCSWHWNHKHLEIPFLSQNGLGRYHSTTRNKML